MLCVLTKVAKTGLYCGLAITYEARIGGKQPELKTVFINTLRMKKERKRIGKGYVVEESIIIPQHTREVVSSNFSQ